MLDAEYYIRQKEECTEKIRIAEAGFTSRAKECLSDFLAIEEGDRRTEDYVTLANRLFKGFCAADSMIEKLSETIQYCEEQLKPADKECDSANGESEGTNSSEGENGTL